MTKSLRLAAVIVLAAGGIIFSSHFSVAQAATLSLTVPYTREVLPGTTGPNWKNACEESSVAMIEQFYTGKKTMNISAGIAFMSMLFGKEDALYGSNVNSDSIRIKYMIDNYSDYSAKIANNPTVAQIKSELDAGHPVITMHYGYDLKNPNIPFLRTGTFYHVMVVIGYDDASQQFITNDPGDTVAGKNHRYDYNLFVNSLHDFNFADKKANGPARAVFTYPKLVKVSGSAKIYYLHDNISQYITGPSVIANHNWSWAAVNIVSAGWLDNFKQGLALNR